MAILSAALTWILKTTGTKNGSAIVVVGGLALLSFALGRYREPIAAILKMAEEAGVGTGATAILKMLAVGCLTSFSADICRDIGEATLASRLELCGRAEILLLCLPFVLELFSMALEVVT